MHVVMVAELGPFQLRYRDFHYRYQGSDRLGIKLLAQLKKNHLGC